MKLKPKVETKNNYRLIEALEHDRSLVGEYSIHVIEQVEFESIVHLSRYKNVEKMLVKLDLSAAFGSVRVLEIVHRYL